MKTEQKRRKGEGQMLGGMTEEQAPRCAGLIKMCTEIQDTMGKPSSHHWRGAPRGTSALFEEKALVRN